MVVVVVVVVVIQRNNGGHLFSPTTHMNWHCTIPITTSNITITTTTNCSAR
jgi:hypothetical protein